MLTKFFVFLFLYLSTNQYVFDLNVKGKMTKYNSYTLLQVQLDILRPGKKILEKTCYKMFLDRDIKFKHMKFSYFNQDFKIATPLKPDLFLQQHVEYRFPEKFYSYKVHIDKIDSSKIECMIVYNQQVDDKILRIYLLSIPIDPNRGFYFMERDLNEIFHVFSYPVLSMGKQIIHSTYFKGEQEKNYLQVVPEFLNFPDSAENNGVQEQIYEKLKIQFKTQDGRLYAVDMNQSFDEVLPIRYVYQIYNDESKKLETKIIMLFQRNDGIDNYFFHDKILFFSDKNSKNINIIQTKEGKPFHVDAFSFQNFQTLVQTSLQKGKSLPVQKITKHQYKSFNYPSRLPILINKNIRMRNEDTIKIMSFLDENDQEYRIATFLKELKNKSLIKVYFPICFIYDEKDQVIRVANQTTLYDFDNEEDEVQQEHLNITTKTVFNFKNQQPLQKLKKKPAKFYIRISCKAQEPPYSTKSIFVQLQENNKMCVIGLCKQKLDFVVQKQEIMTEKNSKNESKEYLIIDIQPDISNVV